MEFSPATPGFYGVFTKHQSSSSWQNEIFFIIALC